MEKLSALSSFFVSRLDYDDNNKPAPSMYLRWKDAADPETATPLPPPDNLNPFLWPSHQSFQPREYMPAEEYTFTLTAGDGSRLHGYCRRVLPPLIPVNNEKQATQQRHHRLPHTLCLISPLSWSTFWWRVLESLDKILRKDVANNNLDLFSPSLPEDCYVAEFIQDLTDAITTAAGEEATSRLAQALVGGGGNAHKIESATTLPLPLGAVITVPLPRPVDMERVKITTHMNTNTSSSSSSYGSHRHHHHHHQQQQQQQGEEGWLEVTDTHLQLQIPPDLGLGDDTAAGLTPANLLWWITPRQFCTLLASLLLERRVVLASHDGKKAALAVHAATALLHPFAWQHIYLPLLPLSLKDYLAAPMPYVVGLPVDACSLFPFLSSSSWSSAAAAASALSGQPSSQPPPQQPSPTPIDIDDEVVVFDLDRIGSSRPMPGSTIDDALLLPGYTNLEDKLERIRDKLSGPGDDSVTSAVADVMRSFFVNNIIGNYRRFIIIAPALPRSMTVIGGTDTGTGGTTTTTTTSINDDRIVSSGLCFDQAAFEAHHKRNKRHEHFLKHIRHSQMFEVFIRERLDQAALGFDDTVNAFELAVSAKLGQDPSHSLIMHSNNNNNNNNSQQPLGDGMATASQQQQQQQQHYNTKREKIGQVLRKGSHVLRSSGSGLRNSISNLKQNFASQSQHGGRIVELPPRMAALVNGQQQHQEEEEEEEDEREGGVTTTTITTSSPPPSAAAAAAAAVVGPLQQGTLPSPTLIDLASPPPPVPVPVPSPQPLPDDDDQQQEGDGEEGYKIMIETENSDHDINDLPSPPAFLLQSLAITTMDGNDTNNGNTATAAAASTGGQDQGQLQWPEFCLPGSPKKRNQYQADNTNNNGGGGGGPLMKGILSHAQQQQQQEEEESEGPLYQGVVMHSGNDDKEKEQQGSIHKRVGSELKVDNDAFGGLMNEALRGLHGL